MQVKIPEIDIANHQATFTPMPQKTIVLKKGVSKMRRYMSSIAILLTGPVIT
jgi:hypothetical protein